MRDIPDRDPNPPESDMVLCRVFWRGTVWGVTEIEVEADATEADIKALFYKELGPTAARALRKTRIPGIEIEDAAIGVFRGTELIGAPDPNDYMEDH